MLQRETLQVSDQAFPPQPSSDKFPNFPPTLSSSSFSLKSLSSLPSSPSFKELQNSASPSSRGRLLYIHPVVVGCRRLSSRFVTINSTSIKPSMRVRNLTYMHHIILSASSVHHQCIISASSVHHQCIMSASSVHHHGIIRA